MEIFLYDVADNSPAKTKNNVSKLGNLQGYENFFDLITLMHVLEHVGDPVDFFTESLKLFKPQWLGIHRSSVGRYHGV